MVGGSSSGEREEPPSPHQFRQGLQSSGVSSVCRKTEFAMNCSGGIPYHDGSDSEPELIKSDSEEEKDRSHCILDELLHLPFAERSYSNQFSIVTNGRPTPPLPILTTKTKNCVRHFKKQNYETCSWLCGCDRMNKLFCWPCVLFSTKPNPWMSPGLSDLNNLHNLQKRHELLDCHIDAMLSLKRFGCGLQESFQVDTKKFNQLVKRNRHVVNKLIDVSCFLAESDLPFQSEYKQTLRKGNFCELVNLFRLYDENLDVHITTSNAFSRLSTEFQKDLVDAIYQVIWSEITTQVISNQPCSFLAIILDETTDIADKCQIATIIRFTDRTGDVFERFIGFTDYDKDPLLVDHVSKEIQKLGFSGTLISVSYNGPTFMTVKNKTLLDNVRAEYPETYFVHCYSHTVFANLKNCVDHIYDCKMFFWTLYGLASFFSKSSQRTFSLNQEIRKRFPSHNSAKWEFNSKLITSIFNYRIDIIRLFESMILNGTKWDMETYNGARGFLSALNDFKFNFLLHLFSDIFPQAESLFQLLQEKKFDADYYMRGIDEFQKHLEYISKDYDNFWLQLDARSYTANAMNPNKRLKIVEFDKDTYSSLYYKVIKTLLAKISKDRYSDLENLHFIVLLDPKNFSKFSKEFPIRNFLCLKNSSYCKFFDLYRLKAELCVAYKNSQFFKSSIYELHKFLIVNNFQEMLPEMTRLSELIVTLPLTTASTELSFSASSRVKAFLENNQSEDSPSSLALLSIEKSLLSETKIKPNFHDKVIDHLAKNTNHIELIYKQ